MKKTMYYLTNMIKLTGQLLSFLLSIGYVVILFVFSAVLILPAYFNEQQIYSFLKNYTTKDIATTISAFAYAKDNWITFVLLIVIILILIGLFLFRIRTTLLIGGVPALAFGLALVNLNFFSGIITNKLSQDDLLVFEDIKTNLFTRARNVGLFYMVFGTIALILGIYLFVYNQRKKEKEQKELENKPKPISQITAEKLDFTPSTTTEVFEPIIEKLDTKIICTNCNNELPSDAKFCTKCGQKTQI